MRIGVLALQGDFREHVAALRRLGVEASEVRLPEDLDAVDGLIIPGGESTTIGKLLVAFNLRDKLRAMIERGFPVYGTCAGVILLAKDIGGLDQPLIGTMDVRVERNAFGRQVDSFEAPVRIEGLGDQPFPAVFIRAPRIRDAGAGVAVLGRLDDGTIVAVRQGAMLGSAFHPELTDDLRFHQLFVRLVESRST
ncbi:MAG: pyridoxal 5'-phosphate synthase glutaminase subunit PdxT [Chloroflexi bacterium]|nr:pyridoxal 5'-phosphate synthase glutaminase subunit PdxT [Chloroflexota bacterium]